MRHPAVIYPSLESRPPFYVILGFELDWYAVLIGPNGNYVDFGGRLK